MPVSKCLYCIRRIDGIECKASYASSLPKGEEESRTVTWAGSTGLNTGLPKRERDWAELT